MSEANNGGGGKEKMLATLTRKIGPLPTWGWLVILVAVVAVFLYQRRGKQAANNSTDLNASGTSLEELVARSGGMGGYGGGDNYYITGPINTQPNPHPRTDPVRNIPRRDNPPRFPTPQNPDDEIHLPPRRRRTTVASDTPATPGGRRMGGPGMWIPS